MRENQEEKKQKTQMTYEKIKNRETKSSLDFFVLIVQKCNLIMEQFISIFK